MDTTRAQQHALDDELVAPADRLKIGKSNLRLSLTLKSKEPTLQVVLDALKLTSFYNAFEISADVPEIYMQEFWVTISRHHSSLHFKLNGKSHTVNVDNFRDMLKICPKLPGQKFKDPPLEEDILSFIRDLGHTSEIKFLSDVNDMYHNKKVDYVYLLWEDLVFQVENKNSKKNNDMYYPRFTKVIVDYFMAKDQAIPRRNKMFWHHARDDFMFTTVRVISKHQDTQVYGAILPQHLTNQAMLESEAYMTYRAYATGEKTPKPKTTKKKADSEASPKTKTTQATKGKRIKSSAKGDKAAKKKQPAETSMDKGLTMLSDVALTEAEQLKLVIERSKTQTHSSHASSSGADEGTEDDEDEVNVNEKDDDNDNNDDDDDADNQDDENPDEENQDDDDDEQTDSDNDGDDFVHPKFLTHDDEARQEEDSFDPRVQTPSHVETTDDEDDDEEVHGVNIEDETTNEVANNEEDEGNELYRDLNVNLEGSETVMTDAPLPNVQATQETEDTHVILTAPINPEGQQQSSSVSSGFVSNMLNPRPDTGIDSIFNTEATSLVDVLVTNIVEPPLVFATTLPPPPTPLITHMQQTPFPIPTTAPSTSLQDLPNFGSLFGIVDNYLANKMNEAIKTAVQLQSDRLREEAQAENEDFLNKLDDNIKKIIKDQVKEQVKAQVSKILPKIEKTVNEQLVYEVMTHSSTESKTSLAIAANLSELELKKILIENMESNKSINRSNKQKNLYKALVEAYESDKLILDTYDDTGSKRRRAGKEPESTSTPKEKTSKTAGKSTDGSKSQHKSAAKIPTPDCDWNKTLPTVHGPVQPWLSNLAREEGSRESFDELMDNPLDFLAFMMNCLVELEYFFEEVYKATTEQLDWHNPEVIPFDHFINNDLAYLSGGVSNRTYATFVTNTKATDYGHIKWIEDLVPNTIWSEVPVNYNKHALWGISHWGRKRQQFYGFAANRESARDVNSKCRIIAEGDFKRLCLQDIEDMLILLVQGKLTNLNVEDRLAFGVSLRMFTRSIVITTK
ncbi:hypothetical protein Tco_1446529 [Tanacetum coccineum]